jgi:hypothetical protein
LTTRTGCRRRVAERVGRGQAAIQGRTVLRQERERVARGGRFVAVAVDGRDGVREERRGEGGHCFDEAEERSNGGEELLLL